MVGFGVGLRVEGVCKATLAGLFSLLTILVHKPSTLNPKPQTQDAELERQRRKKGAELFHIHPKHETVACNNNAGCVETIIQDKSCL